ncbi:ABC transporter permease [Erysipelothrix tonsillarum]|uniref:ABC transporter permease n=1 Tax=Erysipelothrix tonsillarum TaxID=38402 RepID=UPI00037A9FB2|nr:ABC transporter permease [Erysipelothrix tonsillarum]
MDNGIIQLSIIQFSMIYLLLVVVLLIMKRAKIEQTRLLLTASIKMSVQLYLSGLILTYIFGNPHPLFVVLYLLAMVLFSTYRILKKNPRLNDQFKRIIFFCLTGSGLFVVAFFVGVIVRTSIFNPQYAIPVGGMIIGNAMNGLSLGIKTLTDTLDLERNKVETLLNLGVSPKDVLLPFVNKSLEMALLPTLNNMLNMGIISLPGMMTGQILSGTAPLTAIMYQTAIMIAITTGVALTTFTTLNFGYKTLINKHQQINWYQ